ncbi:hypothetical protein [[Mycobacterium] crassicus]|uniref:Uncharacterized protein n=1 Tax=[Mycobacterium] crassicus TaxID=2872309 RepID=A0ABU5XFK5_9MYCO|nr:hypothetical protein [Mycolicibacter sp. MYC098]MEB3020889.1 hypothetical protein [Mycolicibacter sp. MYC098]
MTHDDYGATRDEVRIETGKRDGKRQQQRRRFDKLQDAIDAYNGERGDRSRGVQVTPTSVTLRQAVDAHLNALASAAQHRQLYQEELAARDRGETLPPGRARCPIGRRPSNPPNTGGAVV